MPGVDQLLSREGLVLPKVVHRAVLVGTRMPPGSIHRKPDGTDVRTLWGEIAWQLGGKEGYRLVADADRTATSPGEHLTELFTRFSPCIILIDEWVAYARQLHSEATLPAGTFDTQFTFAQALCDAVKDVRTAQLVVTVP